MCYSILQSQCQFFDNDNAFTVVEKEQYRAKNNKVRKMPARGRGRQVPGPGVGQGRGVGQGQGRGRGVRMRGGAQRRARARVTDEIRATIIDHVINHSRAVTAWFDAHPRTMSLFLAPYSPLLNPIEELFSAWRWKVLDHRPHHQMSLLDAMDAANQDTTAEHCEGWMRHAKILFPRCLYREYIRHLYLLYKQPIISIYFLYCCRSSCVQLSV